MGIIKTTAFIAKQPCKLSQSVSSVEVGMKLAMSDVWTKLSAIESVKRAQNCRTC
jgi:hypothetical protein